jgi:hypothetical protein
MHWIKFSDQKPKKESQYLIAYGSKVRLACWEKGKWLSGLCTRRSLIEPDQWCEIIPPEDS